MNYQIFIKTYTNSTNIDSTSGNKLVFNYQISADTNSTNGNSTTASKLEVNYQISTNTN